MENFRVLKYASTLYDTKQYNHDSYDKQDMNETSHGVSCHQSEKPEYDQYYSNEFQHSYNPLSMVMKFSIGRSVGG